MSAAHEFDAPPPPHLQSLDGHLLIAIDAGAADWLTRLKWDFVQVPVGTTGLTCSERAMRRMRGQACTILAPNWKAEPKLRFQVVRQTAHIVRSSGAFAVRVWPGEYGSPDECIAESVDVDDWLPEEGDDADAANDSGPETEASSMPIFCLADLHGKPTPERREIVPGMIPDRNVTEVDGDGGVGKSKLIKQLGVAVATGRRWLGRDVAQGPVLYFACEDEIDEIHIRAEEIARHYMLELSDLSNFHCIPMVGRDAILATEPKIKGAPLRLTPVYHRLRAHIARIRPKLVVLDTRNDIFGGEANNPLQARQFITALRALAIEFDCALILLSHPSLTGLSNGRGGSGSVAWRNSARGSLLMERVTTKDDSGRMVEADTLARTLTVKKLNYGPDGGKIALRWHDGVFVAEESEAPTFIEKGAAERRVDELFLTMLAAYEAEGRPPNPTTSRTGAPVIFAADPRAKGTTKRAFGVSMNRLLARKAIEIVTSGPPSRRVQRLAITTRTEAA